MSPSLSARPHTRWAIVVAIAVVASVVIGVFVLAFTWPSVTSTVQNIPVAVAGTGVQADAVAKQLEQAAGAELTVTRVGARGDAVSLLKTRDVFGAVVIGDSPTAGPEILVAGANGATVTQVMTAVAGQIQVARTKQLTAQGVPLAQVPTVPVTDVVSFASTDQRGAGLGALAFPLVIGGVVGGVLFTLFVAGVWRRLVGVMAYAAASGIVVVAIAQDWFGILQGDAIANGIAIGSSTLAIGGLVVGVTALLGPRGVAIGAALALLIGNPMSGSTQPRQFLPDPWGAVGQWFAPGASATLLRDLSYFPDAATTFPWLVLSGWVALGVVLVAAGHTRSRGILVPHDSLEGHEPEAAYRDPHDARQPV
ncbi:hypothetical protein AB4Z38_22310 [Arthrobacter sp. 2RAF6]|uniref:hypothetical protein n=1 Tax=Arthrobacter sp. 2RAF6 TaxID=3233002 RepID=UPI003F93B84C